MQASLLNELLLIVKQPVPRAYDIKRQCLSIFQIVILTILELNIFITIIINSHFINKETVA